MDQLPRLGKRELICLLLFTCNYVVSVWRGFLFLWVLGIGFVILLWHSLSLPYNYFSRKENKTLPNLPKCNKFDLPSLNITTPGIKKLLKKINVSKSVGPDNIFNAILKTCASQLAPGLSAIFQKSVDSGELQMSHRYLKGWCISR